MILQFRGYKNNWVYEYAESIAISTVEITKADIHTEDNEEELSIIKDISSKIEQEIKDATSCGKDIVYITDKLPHELGYVKVAVLANENKHIAYVFDTNREVYLLNDNGKTVRRV